MNTAMRRETGFVHPTPVFDPVVGADPLNDLSLCQCHHKPPSPPTPDVIRKVKKTRSLRHGRHVNSPKPPRGSSTAATQRSATAPVTPRVRRELALRVELCLPRSLISRADGARRCHLGLGRRPGTQGQSNYATPLEAPRAAVGGAMGRFGRRLGAVAALRQTPWPCQVAAVRHRAAPRRAAKQEGNQVEHLRPARSRGELGYLSPLHPNVSIMISWIDEGRA